MRNPSYRRVAWVLTALVALGCALPAQAGKKKEKEKEVKPKADPYAVVQVDADIRVCREAAISGLKKEIDQKYKAELADYQTAAKEAKKKKEKFEQKRPKKAKLRILKKKLKDQAEADAFVVKFREKESKKQEGKDDKGKDEKGKDDKGKKGDKK